MSEHASIRALVISSSIAVEADFGRILKKNAEKVSSISTHFQYSVCVVWRKENFTVKCGLPLLRDVLAGRGSGRCEWSGHVSSRS